MIIGITGTIGAGKGTVVEQLKQKGFAHYSASGILKEILTERGLPLTRDHMSPLADELARQYPGGVLQVAYERAKAKGETNVVLEAIHRPKEAEYVRSVGGVIWGVDADRKVRYERTHRRHDGAKDEVSYEQFLEHSRREDEGEGAGNNIRAVLNSANAVIYNNGTLNELYQQVEVALKKAGVE